MTAEHRVTEPRLHPAAGADHVQGWKAEITARDGETYSAWGATVELALANLAYELAKQMI